MTTTEHQIPDFGHVGRVQTIAAGLNIVKWFNGSKPSPFSETIV